MKVLLVTPLSAKSSVNWLPVGMAYISSNLKKNGHDCRLFDRYLENSVLNDTFKVNTRMKEVIQEYKPDIIGFSTFSPVIYDTAETVRFIRKFYDAIIVAGGHHATAMPALTLERIPGLDYIITGEGETPILMLANGVKPESIPGLNCRNTNISNLRTFQSPELDNLPHPDYDIFDMEKYTLPNSGSIRGIYLRTADIVSSRGCNNNCVFCSESLTFGRGVRRHSTDYVLDVIERLIADYNINGLYFHDNDFLIYKEHAMNICRELIRKGINKKIKWSIQAGTNRINNDLAKILSEAGCTKIEFGMESVNPDHLNGVRKNRSVEMSEKAIDICRRYGIYVHAYFMTGFKDETIEDLNSLISWIKIHQPHTFQLGLTKIYPGTQLYETNGNKFFESNPWTEYELYKYFSTDFFSAIKPEERYDWNRKIYYPFYRKYYKKALIRSNPISALIKARLNK